MKALKNKSGRIVAEAETEAEVIRKLMDMGMMTTVNQVLDVDTVVIAIGNQANPLIPSRTPGLAVNRRGNIVADPEAAAHGYYFDALGYHLYYKPLQVSQIIGEVQAMRSRIFRSSGNDG
jgi:hypothetical protein